MLQKINAFVNLQIGKYKKFSKFLLKTFIQSKSSEILEVSQILNFAIKS